MPFRTFLIKIVMNTEIIIERRGNTGITEHIWETSPVRLQRVA